MVIALLMMIITLLGMIWWRNDILGRCREILGLSTARVLLSMILTLRLVIIVVECHLSGASIGTIIRVVCVVCVIRVLLMIRTHIVPMARKFEGKLN